VAVSLIDVIYKLPVIGCQMTSDRWQRRRQGSS